MADSAHNTLSPTIDRRAAFKGIAALGAIGSAPIVAQAMSPDERIAEALERLRSAIAEKYPQFAVSCEDGEDLMRFLDGRVAGVNGYQVRLWACPEDHRWNENELQLAADRNRS